ncbi:MAG: type IV pilus modification protein PilV [Gammaproteobacteria bacterium]|nr:type IV pilus modification protein PilV [Gammaproteobacteria bacterium]MBT7306667.1 type IV pilus modification protein PilV [Gammaproteobacteria bacterium]
MRTITVSLPKLNQSTVAAHAGGYTLIETLIALFLLTTSLLGYALLTGHALQTTQGAIFHDLATLQAVSLAERIRANPVGVADGEYLRLTATPSGSDCSATHCDPAAMARYDFREWNLQNRQLLPHGVGSISSPSEGLYQVTLEWMDHRVASHYSLHFSPP